MIQQIQNWNHPYGCNCYSCAGLQYAFPQLKAPEVAFRNDIEMAGVKKSSISVRTKGGNVNVIWTSRLGALQNQTFFLGDKFYDMEKLSVKYEDGLLSIYCPLKQEQPPEPPVEPEIDIEIK